MYLVDTNIFVDFLRGRMPHGYDIMRASDPRLFKVPAIVEAELLVGAEKSRDPERARFAIESLLLPFEVVPFCSKCARHYGRVRSYLEREGKLIGPNDLLIAATALEMCIRDRLVSQPHESREVPLRPLMEKGQFGGGHKYVAIDPSQRPRRKRLRPNMAYHVIRTRSVCCTRNDHVQGR